MLEIDEVVVEYGGTVVLSNISFSVDEKGIYGILGASESGKTALARVICGCEDVSGGRIAVNGEPMSRNARALKRNVRLVQRKPLTDERMTVSEYLDFTGDALGIELERRYRQIKEALELTGLERLRNTLLARITPTEYCRLSIAASLLGNPEYIIIDDVLAEAETSQLPELYELLELLGRMKTVVLLSSRAADVKRLCDSVWIISGGKIALNGRIEEIEQKLNATHALDITVRGDGERILDAVRSLKQVVSAKIKSTESNNVHSLSVEYYPIGEIKSGLLSALASVNASVQSFREIVLTLDDVLYSLGKGTASGEKTEDNGEETEGREKKKHTSRRKKI